MQMKKQGAWIASYLTIVAVWGGSYGITDVALTGLTPVGVAMWRSTTGAAFLAAVLVLSGRGLPRLGRNEAAKIALLAALTTAAQICVNAAQTRIPSGLVAVLCATTPLITVLLFWLRRFPVPPMKWFSLSLGVAGVAVLLSPEVKLDHVGVALGLLAAGLFAVGGLLSADFFPDSTFSGTQITMAQLVVTVMLVIPINIAAAGGVPPLPPARSLIAALVLGVLAAGVGNALFWHVLRATGPVFAATTHQLVPVVAVVVGAVLLNQPLQPWELIGAGLVLTGLALLLPIVRAAGTRIEDPHLEEGLIGVHCEEACICGNLEAVREEHAKRMEAGRDAA